MASKTRYDATGAQAETESGSNGRVPRNLLGIKRVGDIKQAESQALLLAQAEAVQRYGDDQRFTAVDICDLHRLWLGPLYSWAGDFRTVNMGKGGFQFAHAPLIQRVDGRVGARGVGPIHSMFACTRCPCGARAGGGACGTDFDTPVSRWKWPRRPPTGGFDGVASRLAAVGFFSLGWARPRHLHCKHSRGDGAKLCAAGSNF